MKNHNRLTRPVCAFAVIASAAVFAWAQQPAPQERIAMLKQSLAQSKAQLQKYEWIETTTVLVKGEVKSSKQNRCYYGVDGALQKVPIAAPPAPPPPPQGRRGRLKARIVANKTEEMTDYMKRAVDLVHQYVPPNTEMVQSAKDHGKASIELVQPNKVIRLRFKDYIKPGDSLSARMDIASNSLVNVKVTTYLDSAKDSVLLAVTFARLPDGTSYSGQTTLDATAKQIKVVIANTGHRLVSQ